MNIQKILKLNWECVAHASYNEGKGHEYVYKAVYKNYWLYRNGKKYQIEEIGTEQNNWLSLEEFEEQLTKIATDGLDILNTKSYS